MVLVRIGLFDPCQKYNIYLKISYNTSNMHLQIDYKLVFKVLNFSTGAQLLTKVALVTAQINLSIQEWTK